jgi:hypothetical protein
MAGKEETPTCRKKTVTWTISIPSKSVQVFWFKFLVWYTRSKNLNSRNLNGDLDAKLASCITGLSLSLGLYMPDFIEDHRIFIYINFIASKASMYSYRYRFTVKGTEN